MNFRVKIAPVRSLERIILGMWKVLMICPSRSDTAVFLLVRGLQRPLGVSMDISSIDKIHCKKRLAIFLSQAGMSLTKLSLAGHNLIIPDQEEFG